VGDEIEVRVLRVDAADRKIGLSQKKPGDEDSVDTTEAPTEVGRYASLLLSGTYATEYLRIGFVED